MVRDSVREKTMNFKRLVTAGLTAMLPLGLVFMPTDKAQSQASCGVQDLI